MAASAISPIRYIPNTPDGDGPHSQLRVSDIAGHLRQQGAKGEAASFTVMAEWATRRGFRGELALALFGTADHGATQLPEEHMLATCGMFPCDIVSQWGTRQELRLLYPIWGHSEAHCRQLYLAARAYCQGPSPSDSSPSIPAMLTFAATQPFAGSDTAASPDKLQKELQFVEAWKYVITISFPIAEQEVWLAPLDQGILQRHGGEVDLPQELRQWVHL